MPCYYYLLLKEDMETEGLLEQRTQKKNMPLLDSFPFTHDTAISHKIKIKDHIDPTAFLPYMTMAGVSMFALIVLCGKMLPPFT